MLEVAWRPEVLRREAVSRFHDSDESLESNLIWLFGEASQVVSDRFEEYIDERWAPRLGCSQLLFWTAANMPTYRVVPKCQSHTATARSHHTPLSLVVELCMDSKLHKI